ncbi:MAG TPA: DUF2946 family protein [Usitatibacter sp.]|nr:DUF2946 family protein [Usitatibacter sp.]
MRRFAACFALFAVAWVALLPLVSSAHDAVSHEQSLPPCHQAVVGAGAGTPSPDPAPGGSPCAHCAFCVIALVVLPSPPVPVPLTVAALADTQDALPASPHPADLSARIPDSRAPPPQPA